MLGKNDEKLGSFSYDKVLYIGTLIDEISDKIIPYKNEINIKKTLNHINKELNINAESILLVDDDEEFLAISKFYLKKLGHYVEAYNCSEKAYYALKNSPGRYSRVIVDQNMPSLNGDSFINLISEEASTLKVCILTASISSVPPKTSDKYPVIQKPCNMINIVGAASKDHITGK